MALSISLGASSCLSVPPMLYLTPCKQSILWSSHPLTVRTLTDTCRYLSPTCKSDSGKHQTSQTSRRAIGHLCSQGVVPLPAVFNSHEHLSHTPASPGSKLDDLWSTDLERDSVLSPFFPVATLGLQVVPSEPWFPCILFSPKLCTILLPSKLFR